MCSHRARTFSVNAKSASKKSGKKTVKKAQGTLKLLKDLNLAANKSNKSFEDFVTDKKPKSNIQFNAIAVYYLKKIVKEKNVGPNHVYTCYKNVNRKTPKNYTAFTQSLRDTASNDWGYIDADDIEDIK